MLKDCKLPPYPTLTIRYSLVERKADLNGNNLLNPQYDLKIETEGQTVILPAHSAERLASTYEKLLERKLGFSEDTFY